VGPKETGQVEENRPVEQINKKTIGTKKKRWKKKRAFSGDIVNDTE